MGSLAASPWGMYVNPYRIAQAWDFRTVSSGTKEKHLLSSPEFSYNATGIMVDSGGQRLAKVSVALIGLWQPQFAEGGDYSGTLLSIQLATGVIHPIHFFAFSISQGQADTLTVLA